MKRTPLVALLPFLVASASTTHAQQPAQPPASAAPAGSVVSRGPSPAGSLAAALEAAGTTDYANAEKLLKAIQGADRAAALVALARVMLELGRFAEAGKYAQAAAAAAPAAGGQRLVALALEGEILAAQGRVDEAIKLLEPQKAAQGTGGRHVRLVLGELLVRAGRRVDAEPVLMEFANEYGSDAITSADAEGLAMVGRAMHLLRHAKDANRAYNESERAERGRDGSNQAPAERGLQKVQTLLWRAALYLDKYDPGHAEEVLVEARKIAPHRADVLAMLARVKLAEAFDFEAAEKLAGEALAIDPKHTGAFAVRAGIALHDMNLNAANAAVDAGLAVDPNDLELLSDRAAARLLADDQAGFAAAKRDVFARNKEYSTFYGTVGEYAEWEHRYDDVVAMMKEAVALDPQDEKAWAQLGLWQTRAGKEQEGVKSLEEWWKHDHFNVRAFNTLEKLYGQWLPKDYESTQAGIFDVRYPKAERPVLERYLPRMLGEAWGQMKVHYAFAPTVPVHVETYESREHFSVRTSGLPNIGIQGVCFGHVVAAMSPQSEPFNWGNVLWHELAHVFAIQLSKNHVPRWFTEGLSEYETMIRRPEWQRELDPEFYLALKKGALPGAVDMNRAFTHAEGDLDVTVAYYAASQMLAFTAVEYGFAKIAHALELWGQGRRTADVIRAAFGVSPEDYDARFRAWATARLARYQGQYMFDVKPLPVDEAVAAVGKAPQSAPAHVVLALSLLRAHKIDEARREVAEALRLDAGEKDAHYVAAKLASTSKDVADAEQHLRAIYAAGGDGYTVRMGLAEVAEARGDAAGRRAGLEAAHRFDATQVEPLKELLKMARAEKRTADELPLLREIARLDQHDRAVYRALLGRLVADKQWDEARRVGDAALYVDVESATIHSDYARALAATGDHEKAAFELESALLCESEPREKATAHALLARERQIAGDVAGARAHRDEALRLDPENAEARGLSF
jgi:tetratricopeptide (TPR) repeat protein